MFLVSLFSSLLSISSAQVWTATNQWNESYEAKYSMWVANNVKRSIFSCKGVVGCVPSPYNGIDADCADATYSLRLIFAYENSLPFSAKNPMALPESSLQRFSNDMTRFNNIPEGPARVVAFANYLGQSLGTETLSANDSFSLKLNKISSGDFYMYKIKKNGQFIRHSYNIKNIDRKGNFNLIYATQASKAAGSPLYERVKQLYNYPAQYSWGFRRYMMLPEEMDQDLALQATSAGDKEQFSLAKKLSEEDFFKYVKTLLATEVESPDEVVTAKMKELCDQLTERVDVVSKALRHLEVTNNQCMDYEKFDTHSTPSRDGRLRAMVETFAQYWASISHNNQLNRENSILMEGLFSVSPSNESIDALKVACPISYKKNEIVDLRTLTERISQNLLSSHPNDGLESRWGETTDGRTKCHAFY